MYIVVSVTFNRYLFTPGLPSIHSGLLHQHAGTRIFEKASRLFRLYNQTPISYRRRRYGRNLSAKLYIRSTINWMLRGSHSPSPSPHSFFSLGQPYIRSFQPIAITYRHCLESQHWTIYNHAPTCIYSSNAPTLARSLSDAFFRHWTFNTFKIHNWQSLHLGKLLDSSFFSLFSFCPLSKVYIRRTSLCIGLGLLIPSLSAPGQGAKAH